MFHSRYPDPLSGFHASDNAGLFVPTIMTMTADHPCRVPAMATKCGSTDSWIKWRDRARLRGWRGIRSVVAVVKKLRMEEDNHPRKANLNKLEENLEEERGQKAASVPTGPTQSFANRYNTCAQKKRKYGSSIPVFPPSEQEPLNRHPEPK